MGHCCLFVTHVHISYAYESLSCVLSYIYVICAKKLSIEGTLAALIMFS